MPRVGVIGEMTGARKIAKITSRQSAQPVYTGSAPGAAAARPSTPLLTPMLSPLSSTQGSSESPHSADHFVQFYEDDGLLIEQVAEYIDSALRAGDAGIVLATPLHREQLSSRLRGLGPRGSGELFMLDADETLARILRHGRPDEALFGTVVGGAVVRAAQGGARKVHLFGEMVALLVARGDVAGALEIEQMWNRLHRLQPFSLFCAYPMALFKDKEDALAFRHVCEAHGRVRTMEAAGDAGLLAPQLEDDPRDRLIAMLQQRAAALESEVTRRKRAEATLRERERELSDFLENAAEGIHRIDRQGIILWANRAEMELLGHGAAEYIGRPATAFHVDASGVERILARLEAGETLRDHPATLRCKDGSLKHVLINANGHFDHGRFAYARCFTRDVSDRHARRVAEAERSNLLTHAPIPAAILDGPRHVIRMANAAYRAAVGRHDLIGRPYAEVFAGRAHGEAAMRLLDEVYATGERRMLDEHRVEHEEAPGRLVERYFKVSVEPLRNAAGEVYALMALGVDVTDQVNARKTLEAANAEREALLQDLAAASRAKDEFLAMLGHELRNPLAPISTALELMRMRGETATAREQEVIQRQVDHLIRLVDDLMDVSKITRGKIALRRQAVDVAEVLSKVIEMASPLLEQRRHRLTIDVPPGPQPWVGDPDRLAQVVANLLTNAARYTDPGGDIALSLARTSEEIVIRVRDNGRGMTPEVRAHVFELFYQGGRSLDRAEGGLGIGLALVRNLVEMHGGRVEALSDGPGRGSEFAVHLPAGEPSASEAPAAPAHNGFPLRTARARRVLIVDDNIDAADSLGQLVTASGHTVHVVYDPVSALRAIDNGLKPDIAVLDVGLPVMSGYELARHLRHKTSLRGCRLIALTGYGQEGDRDKSREAGFDAHLVKPIDFEAFTALLS